MTIKTYTTDSQKKRRKYFMIHHASPNFDLNVYEQNEQDEIVLKCIYNFTLKSMFYKRI